MKKKNYCRDCEECINRKVYAGGKYLADESYSFCKTTGETCDKDAEACQHFRTTVVE